MKFTSSFVALVATLVLSVSAAPLKRDVFKRDVNPNLVPDPQHPRGLNPTGTGDCDGINGIKIPCACPPSRDELITAFNTNYNAGRLVNNADVALPPFPEGNSAQDEIQRIQAAIIVLQNLNGAGSGCPAVSTTFQAQIANLQNGGAPSAPAPAPAPPPPAAAAPPPPPPLAAPPAGGSVRALAPEFGHAAGVNPTGTGDCDGAVNGPDGRPIKIPCFCPPDREEFLTQLEANVAAGVAVNNRGVSVSFPLDNSPQAESARITASLITLQNLRDAGQGCPAASTTLLARQRALGV